MFGLVLAMLIGILLVLFGAQNAQAVNLHFLAWETTSVPLVLALGIAMLVGVVMSLLLSIPTRIHGRQERRALTRQIEAQDRALATPYIVPADPIPDADETNRTVSAG
ncbi:MAG: LapA family protein [Chloroflexi bacterium]|nr:LapA family protein [Chloroflexota bacterium]MDA1240238.1 LapA family protein [Chloroflexota bacterium]